MPRIEQSTYDPNKDIVAKSNPLDAVSRERWAIAAGTVMARTWAPVLLNHVVACGYDEFERQYRPIANQHGFKQSDIRAIFQILVRAAELNPVGSSHVERMPQVGG